jgi:hypothetical protein
VFLTGLIEKRTYFTRTLLRRDDKLAVKIIEESAVILKEDLLPSGFIFFRQQSRVK